MIEAEKAQHLWFAVGFLWVISIVIAFFIAKIIKPKHEGLAIEYNPPNLNPNQHSGHDVSPSNLKYDFPRNFETAETPDNRPTEHPSGWQPVNLAELKQKEHREGYIGFVQGQQINEQSEEQLAQELLSGSFYGNIRDDVKEAAAMLDEVISETEGEIVRERITITIVTTKEALAKLEDIKKRTGKSYSRVITEKIINSR